MKRLIISACSMLTVFTTIAQSAKNESVHFIPRIGMNFSNVTTDKTFIDGDTKLKIGFLAGVDLELPIAPTFYLQPGLLFRTKGAKYKGLTDGTIQLSYLEIPVSFMYKPVLGEGRFLIGAGPYAAMAMGGKVKDDTAGDKDIEFSNKVGVTGVLQPTLKRMDYGIQLVMGYELQNNLSFQLDAQLGLRNIMPEYTGVETLNDSKFKNTLFSLSAGYRF